RLIYRRGWYPLDSIILMISAATCKSSPAEISTTRPKAAKTMPSVRPCGWLVPPNRSFLTGCDDKRGVPRAHGGRQSRREHACQAGQERKGRRRRKFVKRLRVNGGSVHPFLEPDRRKQVASGCPGRLPAGRRRRASAVPVRRSCGTSSTCAELTRS